jgi:superfamily II DNA or RNA helicase
VPSEQALRYPDTPFALRAYQVEAIQTVIAEWKQGASAQMVMLPTGCGKTIVFACE